MPASKVAAALCLSAASALPAGRRPAPAAEPVLSQSILAAAASTSGANGTHYVSAITLANPHDAELAVTLYVLPAGQDNSGYRSSARSVVLPPHGGTRIVDPLATLWGTGGLATILAQAQPSPGNDGAFVLESRVSNVANPAATFGLSIPGTLSGIETGDVGYAPDAESDGAYRTNVGLFNDSEVAASALVELLADDGSLIGSRVYGLAPFSLFQGPLTDITTEEFARATVRVTPGPGATGPILGYISVVDNATGDGAASMIRPYAAP